MGNCAGKSQASVGILDDRRRTHTFDSTDSRQLSHKVLSEDEAKSLYKEDCALKTKSHLELRALLDYPLGREFLLENSKSAPPFAEVCLNGWLDIQAFNSIPNSPTKLITAKSVYTKYVMNSVVVSVQEQLRIAEIMHSSSEQIVTGLFDDVKSQLFDTYNTQVFVKIRTTPEYQVMCAALRRKYSSVKQRDFLYHRPLGQGGFGLVLEVSKKSTGARYAMKLLRKDHMVSMCGDEPWRANLEKRAMASCHHPFIVELYFAFRTSSMVGMVISLGTGLDLSKVLRASGPLSVEQVRFYAAEITSALSYLHHQGLVYRDLKPANILLNLDGHIQLTDFGCVCDVGGKILAHSEAKPVVSSPLFIDAPTEPEAEVPPLSQFWIESTANPNPNNQIVGTSSARGGFSTSRSFAGSVDYPADADLDCAAGPDFARQKIQITSSPDVLLRLRKRFFELSEAEIVRHLLQCGCKYDKTVTHIEECLLWRQSYYTFTEKPNHHTVGPGCFLYTHGFDIEGHPLIVLTIRQIDQSKNRDLEEIIRWMAYIVECTLLRLPPHLQQYTVLSNRIGTTAAADLELAKRCYGMLEKNYPHRMFRMYFYPVPVALQAIGGIYKSISGKAAKNFRFVKSLTELRNEIPDEYIPAEMGGSCTYEFNIDDYPAPAVCEPYRYCTEHGLCATVERQHEDVLGTYPGEASSVSRSEGGGCFVAPSHSGSVGSASDNNSRNTLQPPVVESVSAYGFGGEQNHGLAHGHTHESESETLRSAHTRAKSIAGTVSYMAPEMMILMMTPPVGFTHTGYTHAVDWWSLGVTMYRLLTFSYPFNTDIPKPETPEAKLTEWSDRYSTLLEEVDYKMFVTFSAAAATAATGATGAAGAAADTAAGVYADLVDIMSQLLTVAESDRLGYGPHGSSEVSRHKFFRDINWIELEKKQSKPPPLPDISEFNIGERPLLPPVQLETMLHLMRRGDWLIAPTSTGKSAQQIEREAKLNDQLEFWDYTSPGAALTELQKKGTKSH